MTSVRRGTTPDPPRCWRDGCDAPPDPALLGVGQRPACPTHGVAVRSPKPRGAALPGRMVDLLRDGVRGDLTRGRIVQAVGRVALSAARRGWSWPDFDRLMTEPGPYGRPNGLTEQVRNARGPARRRATKTDLDRIMLGAWRNAERVVAETTEEQMLAGLADRIARTAAAALAEADHRRGSARAVLLAFADRALEHQTLTPALPRVRTAEETGLTEEQVRWGLRVLIRDRLLYVAEPGRPFNPKEPEAKPLASFYGWCPPLG